MLTVAEELRAGIVVVLATEHADRDAWVDERAAEEVRRNGLPPGGYQGVWLWPPQAPGAPGVPVHLFTDARGVEWVESEGGTRVAG